MVKRSERLAFIKSAGSGGTGYMRMKGFTELSVNANPKEYTRKYIDEEFERSTVTSYQPSISYKFDYDAENDAQKIFLNVSEFELTGDDALCSIVIVDLALGTDDVNGYYATERDFYIIPDSEGNDSDMYTFSGTLKAAGKKRIGYAKSTDEWQTVTVSIS